MELRHIKNYNIKNYILFLFILSGCNLLTPREAEKPIKSTSNWEQPTTPQILINNFKEAIINKSTGNYLLCFIDSNLIKKSYKYNPTYESYIKYPTIFNDWNLLSEKIYFDNLRTKFLESEKLTFSLTNEKYSTILSDSIVYSAGYNLVINHNLSGFPTEYRGNIELVLFRNIGGLWAIGIWSDYLTDEKYATWSQLKGSLSY